MINAALVLEGGSLRGLYTAGVLDVFIEKKIEFSCVIGVSAGAIVASNYISKQKMRTAKINILHSGNQDYYGIYQLITKGNAFNFDYLFHDPINNMYPYDINALSKTKQRLLICVTDCNSGKPVYLENKPDYETMVKYLWASSSIPLLADMISINGRKYLDGGISEPIGIKRAIKEKYKKIVVILTRDKEYNNLGFSATHPLLRIKYKDYPHLLATLNKTCSNYNSLKRLVDEMEENGDIFVIRPQKKVDFHLMEKNPRKLIELYFSGIEDAEANLKQMLAYLGK